MTHRARPAFSLVGMLISLACMAVLFALLASALNEATTGTGSSKRGTVNMMSDQLELVGIFQTLYASVDADGVFPVPSRLDGSYDNGHDTTAALWSMMIMNHQVTEEMVVAKNEYNNLVWIDEDYDRTLYDPASGVYWDPSFVADLDVESNASYAHMPLVGERAERQWRQSTDSSFPVLSHRGPRDGVFDPGSLTVGRNGEWGGAVIFGDGHAEFVSSYESRSLLAEGPEGPVPDNLFRMEEGPAGGDAILAFTLEWTREGPVLQFD